MEHTVTFRLKHSMGSPEETDFLSALEKLAEIPRVKNFRISLGPSWGSLGVFSGSFVGLLGPLGAVFGASWAVWG